jgi:hypothetical protein
MQLNVGYIREKKINGYMNRTSSFISGQESVTKLLRLSTILHTVSAIYLIASVRNVLDRSMYVNMLVFLGFHKERGMY